MIDEKKLIKDLEETVRVSVKSGDCTARKLLGLFMVVITNQPKVGEWVPCGERLPEERINQITNDFYEYPVTVALSGSLDVRYYKFGDGHWWRFGQCMDGCVIAWQPLPEPWEGNEHAERKANKTEVENE